MGLMHQGFSRRCLFVVLTVIFLSGNGLSAQTGDQQIQLRHEQGRNRLRILIGDAEKLVYRYGPDVDLVHFYPVRSPSGRSMTVQQTDPFPHHRSFWFADEVRLEEGDPVHFYNALYSKVEEGERKGQFQHRIRHQEFDRMKLSGSRLQLNARLVWEQQFEEPVLDEHRNIRLHALGAGEYLLDITFTVQASYGDVTFVSDKTHYAWPYIRMNERFNVKNGGGTITNSSGGVNKSGTNMKPAKWVDYSAPVDGQHEGLAMFSHPDNPQPHRWLTRDYGCFGPRRIDRRSGSAFTLEKGETLSRRVGIYVHRGDVASGQVKAMYHKYKSLD